MTIIYYLLILGIVVLVHEIGHFIFAKKAGIYVYEFAIGMGPRIFKFNRQKKIKDETGNVVKVPDETLYSIRLFPIGGFVSMAGEENDPDVSVPEEQRFQSKTWLQRFLSIVSGAVFNFILAIILLFVIGLINGVQLNTTQLTSIDSNLYPTLQEGDKIVRVAGRRIRNHDRLQLELAIHGTSEFKMVVEHSDGSSTTVNVDPVIEKDSDGNITSVDLGFGTKGDKRDDIGGATIFAFGKFFSTIEQMFFTVTYLFTGDLSIGMLAGPIGIYNIVGAAESAGFMSLISLLAFLSINVGFINLLPIPALDGGRLVFLIVEKIKGSPIKPEIENRIHFIAFILLMVLLVYVTFNDILRFF